MNDSDGPTLVAGKEFFSCEKVLCSPMKLRIRRKVSHRAEKLLQLRSLEVLHMNVAIRRQGLEKVGVAMPARKISCDGSPAGKYEIKVSQALEKRFGHRVALDSCISQSNRVVRISRSQDEGYIAGFCPYLKPFWFERLLYPIQAGHRDDEISNCAGLDPQESHEEEANIATASRNKSIAASHGFPWVFGSRLTKRSCMPTKNLSRSASGEEEALAEWLAASTRKY